ncbi:calcium-binding protein [Albimonas sp. CAU 1670]|uniref:calcium-binding protein n=1 Tax=Albimonas sp. CAU 1670 TaxID=3032599 RepID=UPI0023DA4479|nr:calcium-binding protein [Albimonas sp. CAU 1670]MDF2232721.1 calcium-binding protein [Albimonas sp. CAU 1670]
MANYVQIDSTTPRILAGGDGLFIRAGINLMALSQDAILNTDQQAGIAVLIDGGATSMADDGIDLDGSLSSDPFRIDVGETGVLRAAPGAADFAGVEIDGAAGLRLGNRGEIVGGSGLRLAGSGPAAIENAGAISGLASGGAALWGSLLEALDLANGGEMTGATGVSLAGCDAAITNLGAIVGTEGAAIAHLGGDLSVVNRGTVAGAPDAAAGIQAEGSGADRVALGGDGATTGLSGASLAGFASAVVVNDGLILGLGLGGGAARFGLGVFGAGTLRLENAGAIRGENGVVAQAAQATIRNGGEIAATGAGGTALDAGGPASGGLLILRNDGVIAAADVAVRSGAGLDRVRNLGEIAGDVDLGDGADQLRNGRGDVTGDVRLGAGNDTFRGGSGEIGGRVLGGDDNDTLLGGRDDDDWFEGGGGHDLMKGRGGDDVIRGGFGQDTLAGGPGDDELTGGALADVFRFGRRAGEDEILDFEDGVDAIHLRALALDGARLQAVKDASAAISGTAVVIDLTELGGDGSVVVQGLTVALMTADDFIF